MNLSSHKLTMLTLLNVLIFILAIAPSLISATEQAAEQLPAEQVLAEHPLFPSYSEVQLLNEQSFDSKVKNEARTTWSVVAFVKPDYESCKEMASSYSTMARALSSTVHLYAVDCYKNGQLCNTQGITAYPTYKAFPIDNKEAPVVYESTDLSQSAILRWIMVKVPNHIERIDPKPAKIRKWLRDYVTEHRAILFTESHEDEVPIYWKVIDSRYHTRLHLAVVRDPGQAIRKEMKFPGSKVFLYHADCTDRSNHRLPDPEKVTVPFRTSCYPVLNSKIEYFLRKWEGRK